MARQCSRYTLFIHLKIYISCKYYTMPTLVLANSCTCNLLFMYSYIKIIASTSHLRSKTASRDENIGTSGHNTAKFDNPDNIL